MRNERAFTLIELLVAIGLSTILLGAVYYTLRAALESWEFTRDELALQQVLSDVQEEMLEGTDEHPGLRASLEVAQAWADRVSFVFPWTEGRIVSSAQRDFQLSQYVRLGAGLPVAEFKLPDASSYRTVPVAWEDPDSWTEKPRLRPAFEVIRGSTLRISYHPDPERAPDSVVTFRWDPESKILFREKPGSSEPLGKNPFGVALTACRFRYYDHLNAPLQEGSDVPDGKLLQITEVEVELSGRLRNHEMTVLGMAMLRNSVRQSGMLILSRGVEVPVPDSDSIKTLFLTNLVGVSHEDEIHLEIRSASGLGWRVKIRFERFGKARPVVAQVTVEYPIGQAVFTSRPQTSVDLGLDLLALEPSGLYDYDNDPDVPDQVHVTGDPVLLKVTRMDVKGAALFVRP